MTMAGGVKVTINPAASGAMTAEVKSEHQVTDAKGRVLTLRKPNVLAQYRLVKMLGDSARNAAYMAMVTPLTYLAAIDGEPVMPPSTERELDALIQRLDDEGVMAIMDGLSANFVVPTQVEQEAALTNS